MIMKESLEKKLENEVGNINEIQLNPLCDGTSFVEEKNSVISFADAAALCQYTYASNPLYPTGHVFYKTRTGGWIPYEIDDTKTSKKKKLMNGLSGLLGNGAFLGYSQTVDDLTSALSMQENVKTSNKYSAIDYFGMLGGRIEVSSMNPDDLFAILKGRLKRGRTGFRSMLFYKKNSIGNIEQIVYVTEGSKGGLDLFTGKVPGFVDWFGDWILSNASQGLMGLSPQHTLSIQNAKILDHICASKNIKLCFVGHSLGGGLATSNAIATNRPAVVFDMAGLHLTRRIRYPKINEMKLGTELVNYYVKGEFLSGKVYEVLGPNHINQSVELEYKGGNKYDSFTLHNFIFFCKYFNLTVLKDKSKIYENGI